jgi:hypothetical protein
VAALRAENGRLREAHEWLHVLLEDKDAQIAELEARIARLERLTSRNSGNSSMPPVPEPHQRANSTVPSALHGGAQAAPGVAGMMQGGFAGRGRRVLAGWCRAMIGPWGLPRDRAPSPAAGREVSCPVPGCSSGSGRRRE